MVVNYAKDVISNISEDGMTDDLWKLVEQDIGKISKHKINNNIERNLYFYLEHFIDDICEEFRCKEYNKDDLIEKAFNQLRGKEKIDLFDIKNAIYQMIKKSVKKAYPVTKGIHYENIIPEYDISKWVKALSEIYFQIKNGKSRNEVIKEITEEWAPMEKLNFEEWMKYYEHKDHEKYGIEKNAQGVLIPSFNSPNQTPKGEIIRGPGRPRQVVKTLEQEKEALVSRLDSAVKILRKFVSVWPPEVWQRLSGMLGDLQREIVSLKTTATMKDCIIKTANKFNNVGFQEGARELYKVAEGDLANKIERALSGKEPKDLGGDVPPAGDLGLSPEGMPPMDAPAAPGAPGEMPMPGAETQEMPAPDASLSPPAGVEESLPAPEVPPAPPVEEPKEEGKGGVNPFDGQNLTIQDVLDILEPVSKSLSEREFVRTLSKADMILDSLNLASYLPELGEVQAKAIELNLYISSRLEKIINKLKGGLKGDEKGEEKPAPPEIEMGEFSKEPEREKEMFEVKEEAPVPEDPKEPKPGV